MSGARIAEVETLPATAGQERLWWLAEADGSTAAYAVPFGYHLGAPLDAAAFHEAIRALFARHDALRTGLRFAQGALVQEIHRSIEPEVTRVAAGDVEGFVLALRRAATESFDLSKPPLLRCFHAALPGGETALGFVFHHSICDSWTIELLMRDLAAILEGREPEGEAGRHAAWSREERSWIGSEEARRDREHWRRRIGGWAPPLDLARGARRAPRRGDCHRFRISTAVVDTLVRAAVATRSSILLAAYAALLRRYTMSERIIVGLPVAGRSSPEAERTVGYLSNTVIAVEDFSPETTFREAITSALRSVAEGLEHGRLPFQQIVEVAEVQRGEGASLYQAMFGPQDTIGETRRINGAPLTRLRVHNGTAKCDLTLMVESREAWTECELEYDSELFDAAWAERFAAAYARLLDAAAEAPDAPVDALLLLDPGAVKCAFARRAGATDKRGERPAHLVFEAQARATPGAIAVKWSSGSLSYQALDRRANAVAAKLSPAGAGPRPRVGILLDRGPDLVCAVLGALKAGAAFVPLDRRFPRSRIAVICADAGISTVITDAERAPDLQGIAAALIPDGEESESGPGAAVSPDDLAYIYYTSGSTGTPKGVPIDHRCVMVRLAYMRDHYPLSAGEAVLQKTPLIFDIAIWEIFLPLFAGGTIVIAEPSLETDSAYISELLLTEPIALCHFVPSAVGAYLDSVPAQRYPRLRWVIVSGEAATGELLERSRRHFGVTVHSQYGQTETSEITVWDGEGDARAWAALLGWQVGDYSLYVVDPALHPVPPDVPGELCVAARGGLAWGYLNRPRMTAERFVPHPNPTEPGERLYRTGDLARVLGSGLIEYLGRADHQLKVRGCRVEPGEIENVLLTHPGVSSCVVIARPASPSDAGAAGAAPGGEMQLVAYLTGDNDPPSPSALEEHLRRALPWYMIPAAFVRMEGFPRTMSGKIDRARLPPPAREAFAAQAGASAPPAGPLEEAVAAEWSRVLGVSGVGRADDFFRVGGTSLSVVRVLASLGSRFGIKLKIADFMRQPTVSGLAEAIERGIEALVEDLDDGQLTQLMDTMGDRDVEP